MIVGRLIGDGLELGPHCVLHAHGKDLHVDIPQVGRRVPEWVGRLAVCDQDHDAGDVLSGAAGVDEDPLSDVGHGFASVGGAATVGECTHGFDDGADVMVGVEGKLSVRVATVLHQANLDLVGSNVERIDKDLQEGADFGKVL